MSRSAFAEKHPWTQTWWRAEGVNKWVLAYIISIHALALIGIVLFPIPGLKVFTTALVFASIGAFGTTIAYHRALPIAQLS